MNTHPDFDPSRFTIPIGVAIVPDSETTDKVLAVTDQAFKRIPPVGSLRLTRERVPHVSLFQNMFAESSTLEGTVASAIESIRLPTTIPVRPTPHDVVVWAGYRLFLNIALVPELARFHDTLLVEMILKSPGRHCAGRPADSRPLVGLSVDEDRAYRETGYVFSGADTDIARTFKSPWRAFTMPHFTLGVVDWSVLPAEATRESEGAATLSELRAELTRLPLHECRFDRLVLFRVFPGGVYIPTEENTISTFALI